MGSVVFITLQVKGYFSPLPNLLRDRFCLRIEELPYDYSVLVPEAAKTALVCKYLARSSCIVTALGVLVLPGLVIIVLHSVKSTLEVMNREVQSSSINSSCSSKTRVWDYLMQCRD